jgi:hypothetical protein
MNAHRRIWLVTGVVLIGMAMMLMGGATRSAADTIGPACSTGKPLCVSITGNPDPASRSPVGNDHYVTYSVQVSYDTDSGANSQLVNLSISLAWADQGVAVTTSNYVAAASDQRCSVSSPLTLTCTGTPKSLGPGDPPFGYGPLVFRTASTTADPDDVEASGTNVTVTASAKETPKPPKGGTNVAFVTASDPTAYENVGDHDISIAGGGLSTTLATANAGLVNQSSKLPVPAGAPQGTFTLTEQNYGGAVTCPTGATCFGQNVTTVAVGISPVNLQIVYEGPLPAGSTEGTIGVFHLRDGETAPVFILSECSSATPSLAEITASNGCRLVDLTRLPGGIAHVEISAWDVSNGGWGGIS